MDRDGPLLLGIEIGGTKLQLGLGRGDGRLLGLSRLAIRVGDGAGGILRQIAEALPRLLGSAAGLGREWPSSVGIGFGGPVEAIRGTVIRSHQVEGWDGFDLAGWARATLRIPRVAVGNDADVAGLGEARFGAGVGHSPVFYVTVGSGIGGGLILGGRVHRGSGLGAAEIGHLWVHGETGPHRLEDVASGWSIGSAARRILTEDGGAGPLLDLASADPSRLDARVVAAAARAGDSRASALLDRAARAMGQALGHVVTLIGPRRIILGGGVSLLEDPLWLDPIRAEVRSRAFPPFLETFDIVHAALGEEVVVHGALALAADQETVD